MIKNIITLANVKKDIENGDREIPQCPECGYYNVRVIRKRREDFYGCPIIWRCDCGWEKEIL